MRGLKSIDFLYTILKENMGNGTNLVLNHRGSLQSPPSTWGATSIQPLTSNTTETNDA